MRLRRQTDEDGLRTSAWLRPLRYVRWSAMSTDPNVTAGKTDNVSKTVLQDQSDLLFRIIPVAPC